MTRNHLVVLIPAYNEQSSIGATIEAVLQQTRPADRVVVVPNGCTDGTADVARGYPVTVLDLPALPHRKSEALNTAWATYAADSDIVVCLDADTTLPTTAFADWEAEIEAEPWVGGSCAKFTVTGTSILARMQRAEYAASIDSALHVGSTRVLPGAGCAFRGDVLRQVASRDDRVGPWSYQSTTEDYELTYRIRELGKLARISPNVRAYTDSMPSIKALWGQRLKWQVGTIEDLFVFGWNKLTWKDWLQQFMGLFEFFLKILLVTVIVGTLLVYGELEIFWVWLLLPLLSIALSVKKSLRIPHRDWKDTVIAASFFPNEGMMWLRSAWFVRSWCAALWGRVSGRKKDFWTVQYQSEGWEVNDNVRK